MTEAEAELELERRHAVAVLGDWRSRYAYMYRGADTGPRYVLLRQALSDLYARSAPTDWIVTYVPDRFRIVATDTGLLPGGRELAAFSVAAWLAPRLRGQPATEWLAVLRGIEAAEPESCGPAQAAGSL